MNSTHVTAQQVPGEVESANAWLRLVVTLTLSTIGGVGMWAVVVALPAVQTEFGVARGAASLPYTLTMVSFGLCSIVMGRLSDRFGIIVPIVIGAIALGLGYAAAAFAGGEDDIDTDVERRERSRGEARTLVRAGQAERGYMRSGTPPD